MTRQRPPVALLALLALLAPAAALAACGDSARAAKARQESVEALAALRAYGEDQREAFMQDLGARVALLDRQLDELKARSARATADTRAEIERKLVDLQGRRDELSNRLTDLKQASSEAWTSSRNSTVKAFETLADGINEAAQQFAQ